MSSTSLLGLALPTTGSLSGTWGTKVNTAITALIDSAIAGTTEISTDADFPLTPVPETADDARQAILLCTGARTAIRTLTAYPQSKVYVVINNTTGGYAVQLVATGPTTGVTIANGETCLVAWNGSDFAKIASNYQIPQVQTVSTGSTITPTAYNCSEYTVTALGTSATIAAPSGTPVNGQKLVLRIKDNGTSRALTWTTTSGAYRAVGTTLPASTAANKVLYIGCIYNSQDTYWDVVAVAAEV